MRATPPGSGDTPRDQIVAKLRDYIETTLEEQSLILTRDYWFQHKDSNASLLEPFGLLNATTADKLLALQRIHSVNGAIHDGEPTHGASQKLSLVAKSQGGSFCRMCGRRTHLHVDHILPTSQGGSNQLKNLQILCVTCNLGKGATQFGRLPDILKVRADASISAGLRFLRLSMSAIDSAGRPIGRCESGHLASETILSVICQSPFAAHIGNLRITCEVCNDEVDQRD